MRSHVLIASQNEWVIRPRAAWGAALVMLLIAGAAAAADVMPSTNRGVDFAQAVADWGNRTSDV
jgi:hypothetical protein